MLSEIILYCVRGNLYVLGSTHAFYISNGLWHSLGLYMFLLLTDIKLFCTLKYYFTNCGPPFNCPRHVFTGAKCIFTINDVIPVDYSEKKWLAVSPTASHNSQIRILVSFGNKIEDFSFLDCYNCQGPTD